MLQQRITACVVALLLGGPAIVDLASADTIGDCCLTGYTFMGGQGPYTTRPDDDPIVKDYFLGQPLNYDFSGQNMWGYGWVKFDSLESSPVDSAYLVYDLLGVGAMSVAPATPENPAILDIHSPGDIDVADLGDAGLRATLRDSLDGTTPLHNDVTMTSNGRYCVDITEVYNTWVNDPNSNHGLVFSAPANGLGAKFASFGNADGDAPYISSVNVTPLIPGDANRDDAVDSADAQRLAENWGYTTLNPNYDTFWEMGDFNGDEVINVLDASILAANWGYGAPEAAAVPEPGAVCLALMAFGALTFGGARGQRKHRARM
jgi:hypothetical protein